MQHTQEELDIYAGKIAAREYESLGAKGPLLTTDTPEKQIISIPISKGEGTDRAIYERAPGGKWTPVPGREPSKFA